MSAPINRHARQHLASYRGAPAAVGIVKERRLTDVEGVAKLLRNNIFNYTIYYWNILEIKRFLNYSKIFHNFQKSKQPLKILKIYQESSKFLKNQEYYLIKDV